MDAVVAGTHAIGAPAWAPKFLCHSFKAPILLSDGNVTSCTLDTRGHNRVGSILDDDFDTLVNRFGIERLQTMAEPLAKPLCHSCYTRLPRWRGAQVPRTGWFDETIDDAKKQAYRNLFDPDKLVFNIELSSACNLRCTGCVLADPGFRATRARPNIDLDRLMAWLDGHVHRIEHVRLYHMGETWLHPRWFEFCRFLKQQHPAITLFTSTNGGPLDSEAKLVQVVESGIDHVMFSIHGSNQAETEAYMGKAFRFDAALAAARRLAELRRERGARLHLSWKYLLFEWNDSDESIDTARRLCDEIGFDELHFSITSQPAPSRRFALDSPGWAAMRRDCAEAWPRAALHQKSTPMVAVYPGRRSRPSDMRWELGSAVPLVPAKPAGAPMVVLPTAASDLIRRGRELIDSGRLLEAARALQQGIEGLARPTAALHKTLGDALLAAGRGARAVAAYTEALRLDPQPRSDQLHLGLARSLRLTGQLAEAEAAYEAALRLREAGTPGLYGEDIYLELRDTCRALGHDAAATTAWRMWLASSWLADAAGRTLYCPIAKNAGTFMKAALLLNSAQAEAFRASGKDAHVFARERTHGMRLGNANFISDPRFFSFVLLRDPFERLAAAYGYNFVRPLKWREVPDAPGRAIVNAVHLRAGREPDWRASISFAEFVRHIVTRSDADLDHHWRPQSAFFDDLSVFSHVGCVERLPDTLAVLAAKRHWRFDVDNAALRNALPRAPLPAAAYARMAPRDLATLAGFPSAAQIFDDELRELVARRYADDLRMHRDVMGSDAEPFYPTGGALAYHRQPAVEPAAPPPVAAAPPPLAAPPSPPPVPLADDGPHTLHAAPDATPDADGSALAPMPLGVALKRAFVLQGQGTAVRVWLHDGLYRGSWRVKGHADATAPLTIEAAPGARPMLCGSDVWTDWSAAGTNHQHPWPLAWEAMPAPNDHGNTWMTAPPLMLRREMVYVGGLRLRQVLEATELAPGCFHVDTATAMLSLQAPAGVDIATTQVNVAVRQQLLEIVGAANVTLRGIGFQHDAGGCFDPVAGALRINNCSRVLIEDCRAVENNFRGITIRGSTDVTLRRVVMNHNGAVGLLAARVQRLRLEDCETASNNWRGAWAGFYRGMPCGLKVWRSSDVQISGHRSLHNHATGLWIDEDNQRVTIANAQVIGNRRGIHVEATDGPVDIVNCNVTGNRQEPLPNAFRWTFGSGIAITHARHVTVRACLLSGNDVAQIGVRDDRSVRRIVLAPDTPAREFHSADLSLYGNTIVADSSGAWLRMPDAGFDAGRCWNSLRSDANRFVGSVGRVIVASRGDDGRASLQRLTLPEWRSASGQDAASTDDRSATDGQTG